MSAVVTDRGIPGSAMSKTPIAVEKIVKRYGDFEAVKGLDFAVAEGEIFRTFGSEWRGEEHAHPHDDHTHSSDGGQGYCGRLRRRTRAG